MATENKKKIYIRPSERSENWDTSKWPSQLSKTAIAEAKRSEDLVDTLIHAWSCLQMECDYPECGSMKKYFRHRNTCDKKVNDCTYCKQLRNLCIYHVKWCAFFNETDCQAPFCPDLKEEYLQRKQGKIDAHEPLRSLIAPKPLPENIEVPLYSLTLQDNTQAED